MPQTNTPHRASRRHHPTSLALILALVVGTFGPATAAAAGTRYAGMPQPEAMAAPTKSPDAEVSSAVSYSLSETRARFRAGRYYFYRLDSVTGEVLRKRTVWFSSARRYEAAHTVGTFDGIKYVKIISGPYSGWFVRANELHIASSSFSSPRTVKLAKGTHTGVRFYKNGRLTLRRSATLSAATTYSVSQRAVFNDRVFFYLTDGPLANRWIARSSAVTLVSDGGSDTTTPTDRAPATWKGLLLIYRETDVTFTYADGSTYRLRARMSDSMYSLSRDVARRYVSSVSNWSDNYAAMDLTVIDSPVPLTKLEALSSGKYWVGPKSVRTELDRYAPTGAYDSVIILFQHKDSKGVYIPLGGWGMTLPPGSWSNGAGYSSVHVPTADWWWTDRPNPQEVFVHEWMHQVLFFHEYAGRLDLDLHAGAQYGYTSSMGSWEEWLRDVMTGRVKDGNKLLGVSYEIWRAGTPRRPGGW